MKRSLFLSAILATLLFWGCSQDSTILEPVQQYNSNYSLIKLPSTGLSAETEASFDFVVNGSSGVSQTFNLDIPGTSSSLSASYTFPPNVFEGEKTITVSYSTTDASAAYSPSPLYFNAPVILNITYRNVDLTNVIPENARFVYISPSGSIEPVECDAVIVDNASGTISAVNAKVYHFSRYGFVDDPPQD